MPQAMRRWVFCWRWACCAQARAAGRCCWPRWRGRGRRWPWSSCRSICPGGCRPPWIWRSMPRARWRGPRSRPCWRAWACSGAGTIGASAGSCPMPAAPWCCWPCGRRHFLFPAAVPFGLGQVQQRLETALTGWLAHTPSIPSMPSMPSIPLPDGLPLRQTALAPLSPGGELLCVALGLLAPCLLGYCVIRRARHRVLLALALAALGIALTALSAALSWGPVHAWQWLNRPARAGLWAALALALLLLALPRRACAAMLLLALVWQVALLNQAPTSAYFAQTLQLWEQGRFIRFYGLGQWLGWLWPYATLLYVLLRVSGRQRHEPLS